jgi:hypothetical protein
MKKIMLILMLFTSFYSCKKVETEPSATTEIAAQVTQGTWIVNSFIDNKQRDRTAKYSEYSFVFGANGSFKITTSSGSLQGTWTTQKEGVKERLVLAFSTTTIPEEILDLNDDWYVMDKTSTSIKMQKINGYWETGSVQKEMSFKKL